MGWTLRRAGRLLAWWMCSLPAGPALAQGATTAADCTAIAGDAARLACYDRLHGRVAPAAAVASAPALLPAPAAPSVSSSALARRWDLDLGRSGELWSPRPYKAVYLLPATWTDRVNTRPASPAAEHTVTEDLALRDVEAKYQLSLKSKFGSWHWFGQPFSAWGGYTQSSRWQVYNGAVSRPFRETNYEPELMLLAPLDSTLAGWRLRTAMLSLNHQSNGRSLPLSRSWNRIIGGLAAENGNWVVEARPWLRLREDAEDDDNPDIEDYIGRGELLVTRLWNDQALTLQLRHSLRGGSRSRGSMQMDWAFPLTGVLHGYLQWFSGYGESLVDYNYRENKIGIGITIAGWR